MADEVKSSDFEALKKKVDALARTVAVLAKTVSATQKLGDDLKPRVDKLDKIVDANGIADEKHFNELKNAITDAIAKAANDVNALRNWTEAELNKKSNKIF